MLQEVPTGLTLEDSLYPPGSRLSTSSLDTVSPGRARSPLDMEPVQVGRIPVQVINIDILIAELRCYIKVEIYLGFQPPFWPWTFYPLFFSWLLQRFSPCQCGNSESEFLMPFQYHFSHLTNNFLKVVPAMYHRQTSSRMPAYDMNRRPRGEQSWSPPL